MARREAPQFDRNQYGEYNQDYQQAPQPERARRKLTKFDRMLIGGLAVSFAFVGLNHEFHFLKHDKAAQTNAIPGTVPTKPSEVTPTEAAPSAASSAIAKNPHAVAKKPVVKKRVVPPPYRLPHNPNPPRTLAQYNQDSLRVVYAKLPGTHLQSISGNSIADSLIREAAVKNGYSEHALADTSQLTPFQGSSIQVKAIKPLETLLNEASKLHLPLSYAGGYESSEQKNHDFRQALVGSGTTYAELGADVLALNNGELLSRIVPGEFSLAPTGDLVRFDCAGKPMTLADSCGKEMAADSYALAELNKFEPYVTGHISGGIRTYSQIPDEFIYTG